VPDSWYDRYGRNPTTPGLGGQAAPNGYTYWESFKLDLDPDDDAVPPFLMDRNANGTFRFGAPGGGRQYMLQYTPDLQCRSRMWTAWTSARKSPSTATRWASTASAS
jgi:hypothetical protein